MSNEQTKDAMELKSNKKQQQKKETEKQEWNERLRVKEIETFSKLAAESQSETLWNTLKPGKMATKKTKRKKIKFHVCSFSVLPWFVYDSGLVVHI